MLTLSLLLLCLAMSLSFQLLYSAFSHYRKRKNSKNSIVLEKEDTDKLVKLEKLKPELIEPHLSTIRKMAQKIALDSDQWGSVNNQYPKNECYFREKINERANLILRKVSDLTQLINHTPKLTNDKITEKACNDKGMQFSVQVPIPRIDTRPFEATKMESLTSHANRQSTIRIANQSKRVLHLNDNVDMGSFLPGNGSKPAPEINLGRQDEFLNKVITIIEKHLNNPNLSVGFLSKAMGLSKSQLGRKLSAVSEKSPLILIRSVRIEKAKSLLKETRLTVAEIAYQTGFSDPNYFTRLFVSETNQCPTAFRSQHQAKFNV